MTPNLTNGWYLRSDYTAAAQAVFASTGSLSFMTADLWRAKYIQFRIDQRTGSFLMLDGEGTVLTHDEIVRMFPELAEPVTS